MPINQNAIGQQMNEYIASRKFADMLDLSEKVIDEHQDNYLGRWWKARTLTFMGDTDNALRWLMDAIKVAKDDVEESTIASSMANIYNVKKQWDESLNYTAIALELNPTNVVGVIARSIALTATGEKNEAHKLLDTNKSLYVEDYQKACVASVKRQKAKMLELLKKVLKDNPHNKVTIQYDPDFALYLRDSDFSELIS